MAHDHPQARVSPIFPVTDLRRALAHYAALGWTVSAHDDGYGFAAWGGIELHLVVTEGHDPLRTAAAAYLHVPDADALAAQWRTVGGTTDPVDTDYGLREGAHVDPDNNLLRFGSPLPSSG
jgi:catechol 2,3-dioxygenase-like lactoylglutathione lyase family enzyme